jgi:hypothetical protein
MSDDDNKTGHENQSCALFRITDTLDWAYARAVEGVPPFSGSAAIAADVKRFCHQIKTDEVFGTHR